MSYSNDRNSVITTEMIYVGLGLLVIVAIKMAYSNYRYEVNSILFGINQIEITPFAWVGFNEAQQALETIKNANPGNHSFEIVTRMFTFVGRYMRWFNAFVLLVLTFVMWRTGLGMAYTRKHTMKTILQENSQEYPGLLPVVGRNILDENPHKGPWRIATPPLQFALENELLVDQNNIPIDIDEILDKTTKLPIESSKYLQDSDNNCLDRAKAEQVFTEQLGMKFEQPIMTDNGLNTDIINELPDYVQGLIAVFVAQGSGAEGRKKANGLLDQMNRSFQEEGRVIEKATLFYTETITLAFCIDVTGAAELIEEYGNFDSLRFSIKNHQAYLNVFLMALYEYARVKGLLPSSVFLWLRPTDRLLWYTLNAVGGNTPWAEGAGSWNHFESEKAVKAKKESMHTPTVLGAVDALEVGIAETGWLVIPEVEVDDGEA